MVVVGGGLIIVYYGWDEVWYDDCVGEMVGGFRKNSF